MSSDDDLLRPPRTPGIRFFRRGGCVELGLVIVVAVVAFIFFYSVAAESVPKLSLAISGTVTPGAKSQSEILVPPTETPTEIDELPTTTPATQKMRVANTGGLGAFIKSDHRADAPGIVALAENTVVTIVGPDYEGAEGVWKNVQDDKGNTGWIFSDYLVPVP